MGGFHEDWLDHEKFSKRTAFSRSDSLPLESETHIKEVVRRKEANKNGKAGCNGEGEGREQDEPGSKVNDGRSGTMDERPRRNVETKL